MIIIAESYEIEELKKAVKSIKGPVWALLGDIRAVIDIYAGLRKDGRISKATVLDSKNDDKLMSSMN